MKNTPSKPSPVKRSKKASKKTEPSSGVASEVEKPIPAAGEHPQAVSIRLTGIPSPDELLREAEEEPNNQDVKAYVPVMRTLRRKGFSYREIADWLTKRGIVVDHNAVYRVYSANMPDHVAQEEDKRETREVLESE